MNITKSIFAVFLASLLSGCVTLTAPPRDENTIFEDPSPTTDAHLLYKAVSVGTIEGFPGTSIVTLRFKLAPNYDNKQFKKALLQSLENSHLHGSGYTLNAHVIDLDNWSEFTSINLGTNERNVVIEYTLIDDKTGLAILEEEITGYGSVTNWNPLSPFYLKQREAAEKGYADNIRTLITELKAIN